MPPAAPHRPALGGAHGAKARRCRARRHLTGAGPRTPAACPLSTPATTLPTRRYSPSVAISDQEKAHSDWSPMVPPSVLTLPSSAPSPVLPCPALYCCLAGCAPGGAAGRGQESHCDHGQGAAVSPRSPGAARATCRSLTRRCLLVPARACTRLSWRCWGWLRDGPG